MWAFTADGVGIVVGATMGVTPLTVYIESAAGIEDGGRTGITGEGSRDRPRCFSICCAMFAGAGAVGGGAERARAGCWRRWRQTCNLHGAPSLLLFWSAPPHQPPAPLLHLGLSPPQP